MGAHDGPEWVLTMGRNTHIYSTYLKGKVEDLDSIASELVESGLALCVMGHDGRTHWRATNTVRSGNTTAKLNPDNSLARFKIAADDGKEVQLEGFAHEAWFQASRFRFNELRLFSEKLLESHPFIRAFLGECTFISSTETHEVHITCYPVLKLYASGVLLVQFRLIGASRPVQTKEFIDRYVNLFKEEFELIKVPPGLSKLAPRAYAYYEKKKWSIRERARFQKLEIGHDKAIDALTESAQYGDFEFEAAPLPSSMAEDGELETITSLAQTIFNVVSFVASSPRKGLNLILRGHGQLIETGGFWSGRPHIHLVRFDNQAEKASTNEERHRDAFGWILARASGYKPKAGEEFLPPSSRPFEDYSAYITRAATLWAWSNRGLNADKRWADANRGHLIYANQSIVELLEYGYMLHRSLAETSASTSSSDTVLRIRRDLAKLKTELRQPSPFGEIAELLENGWKRMDVQGLRDDISEGLSISETEAKLAEARASERMSKGLTILFGLIAVPPVASEVINPIWDLLSLWRPANPSTAKIFMISIAIILVTTVIYGISWSVPKSRRQGNMK